MCDPISIVGTVIGIGQQFTAYQQAKSNVAFQNAQNNLQYQSQMIQTQSNRMTEDTREKMNQDFIAHTEFMADLAYERASTRITMEQQQIQIDKFKWVARQLMHLVLQKRIGGLQMN